MIIKIIIKTCVLTFLFLSCGNHTKAEENSNEGAFESLERYYNLLREKADSAFSFCNQKGLNKDFCVLIDMSVHSGKYRLFVWDFKKDTIEHQALCGHGYGGKSTQDKPVFSNVEGSYCTSLGKYKIGARAYSQYGINVHYKLHGYEKTNNNAFKRWIVLHSHTPMPSNEIAPKHLPLGWSQGCPVTDDETMTFLDKKLKQSTRPVLLWIFN